MIFITVGTTDFDALVAAADHLAATTDETVIIQIGHGQVEPQHAQWLRFAPSLDSYYAQADLVVTHGGLGTVTEVLGRGLRLVGVSNPDRFDRHQDQILQAFEEAGHLVWCRDLADLPAAIERARRSQFTPYQPPLSHIHQVIDRFLRDLPSAP
ncbi:MAG TPA: PssE/Cps14G family polysaccharide biosynthesis glycosyltransferase [Anaerolineae bacterium]|nr:PssE/Cps14G family polysaccharide biosynthesis glycosyltransferase [Anaerolineae bacterium]HNU02665.1 PssE/Cps14G family polysaccharide biosynthesis glycosyltransferase [Anaerolineae bacterium]